MANLAAKKSDYISAVNAFSTKLLALTVDADELTAFQTDNGFGTGGTNAITDADCLGPNPNPVSPGANAHLTAAQVNAVMTVVAAVSSSMTAARRTTLRQANAKPNS